MTKNNYQTASNQSNSYYSNIVFFEKNYQIKGLKFVNSQFIKQTCSKVSLVFFLINIVTGHLNSRCSDNLNKSYLKIHKNKTELISEEKLLYQNEERLSKEKKRLHHMSLISINHPNQQMSLQILPKIDLPCLPAESNIPKKQKTFKEEFLNDLNNECIITNNNRMSREAKCIMKETEKALRSSSTNNLSSFRKRIIKGKFSNYTSRTNNKMFQLSLSGTKKVNQDSFVTLPNHFNLEHFDIMAIFDGHGQNGHFISQLSMTVFNQFFSRSDLFYIPRNFTSSPNLLSLKNHIKEEDIYKKIIQNNYKILRDGFSLIEEEINSSEYEKDFSGSTGCGVFVIGKHAVCVNIGDSRAIIVSSKGKSIHTLSIDHKPHDKKERERIIKCGGEVRKTSNEGGVTSNSPYRVWVKEKNYPGLAMSRSLGDFVAKEIGVIAEPDICDYPLSKDDMYIIVASDGIWECLSNSDVEMIVTPFYLVNNIEAAIESLISKAKMHFTSIGEYIDDITVTILFLNKE